MHVFVYRLSGIGRITRENIWKHDNKNGILGSLAAEADSASITLDLWSISGPKILLEMIMIECDSKSMST